jgi:ABC-2 type transport system permease protein
VAWLFVQLKLRLMTGALRGDGSSVRAVGLVLAILGGLYVMPIGFSLLASLHGQPLATDTGVVVFTAAFVGWAVLPLLAFGTDETLDPARLALLPLSRRTTITGLFAAALTGIGPVVTFVVLLGAVAAAATGPGSAVVGLVAVALELALCVTGSRALTTAFSGLLRSRRGRDLGIVAGALLTFAIIGGNIALQQALLGGSLGQGLRTVAGIARWTPPGMMAHAIGAAARGDYLVALLELAAGAVTVAALLWAWMAGLGRALVSPDSSTQTGRRRARAAAVTPSAGSAASMAHGGGHGSSGGDGRAGGGRAGVGWPGGGRAGVGWPGGGRGSGGRASRALTVAAKELRYSWRDPRRKAGWLGLGMAVIVTLSVSRFGTGRDGLTGVIGPILIVAAIYGGTIAGIQSVNQFGLDGSALWLNVAATSRIQDLRADLAGKNLASSLVAMPVFAVLYTALGLLMHQVIYPASAFGMAACALGVTLGITSVASILMPYAVPERRASAFGGGGTGRGCLAGLVNVAILVLAIVLLSPVLVMLVLWHTGLWLLLVGPGYGAAMAWAGRRAGSEIGLRRLPELLAAVSRPI